MREHSVDMQARLSRALDLVRILWHKNERGIARGEGDRDSDTLDELLKLLEPTRSWYYVTEKLPEPEQEVLFWSRWQTVYCLTGKLRITEGVTRFVSPNGPHLLGSGRGEAFAWRPLPEPPPLPETAP